MRVMHVRSDVTQRVALRKRTPTPCTFPTSLVIVLHHLEGSPSRREGRCPRKVIDHVASSYLTYKELLRYTVLHARNALHAFGDMGIWV